MIIERICPFCHKPNAKDLDITPEQLRSWQDGALIGAVMPHLKPGERELLMTGIHDECWPAEPEDDGPEPLVTVASAIRASGLDIDRFTAPFRVTGLSSEFVPADFDNVEDAIEYAREGFNATHQSAAVFDAVCDLVYQFDA